MPAGAPPFRPLLRAPSPARGGGRASRGARTIARRWRVRQGRRELGVVRPGTTRAGPGAIGDGGAGGGDRAQVRRRGRAAPAAARRPGRAPRGAGAPRGVPSPRRGSAAGRRSGDKPGPRSRTPAPEPGPRPAAWDGRRRLRVGRRRRRDDRRSPAGRATRDDRAQLSDVRVAPPPERERVTERCGRRSSSPPAESPTAATRQAPPAGRTSSIPRTAWARCGCRRRAGRTRRWCNRARSRGTRR